MWGMEDRPYNSGGNYGSAPPVHRFAQADAAYSDSYVNCIVSGSMFCDPLFELAQVEGESQVDAEADAELAKHFMGMFCYHVPKAP